MHEISARRRACSLHNAQQTQETNIHVLSGIRIRGPSNRALETNVLDRTATGIGIMIVTVRAFQQIHLE